MDAHPRGWQEVQMSDLPVDRRSSTQKTKAGAERANGFEGAGGAPGSLIAWPGKGSRAAPGIGWLLLNEQGEIVETDPAAARILACSPDDLSRLNIADLDPALLSKFAVFDEGEETSPRIARPASRGDGQPSDLELSLSKLQLGSFKGYLALIGDWKAAQMEFEALRRSEERYKAVFDNSGDAIYLLDAETRRIVTCNQQAMRMDGSACDEAGQMTIYQLHPPREHDVLDEILKLVEAKGARKVVKGLHRLTSSGLEIPVEIVARRVKIGGIDYDLLLVWDVSDQVNAEIALRDSEFRHRIISELTSDYAYAFRVLPEGGLECTWVTAALERITGFSIEDLNRRGGWESLIHSDDLHRLDEQRRNLLQGEECAVEYRIIDFEGETRWMRDIAMPVREASCGTMMIYGAVQDITTEVLAQLALRESEATYRTLVETSPYGVMLLTLNGVVLFCSQRITEQLGYTQPSELIGRRAIEAVVEEEQESIRKAMRQLKAGESISDQEVQFRSTDGSTFWGMLNAALILDPQGEPSAFLMTLRNTTDNKRTLEELASLQQLHAEILANISEVIMQTDVEGRIVFINQTGEKLLGQPQSMLLNRSWLDFVPEDQRAIAEAADRRRKNGECDRYELELVQREGGRRQVIVSGAPRTQDGVFHGTLAVFTDITETERTSQKLSKKTRQQTNLLEHARFLNSSQETDQVLRRIGDGAREILDAYGCSIYMLSADGSTLNPVVAIEPGIEDAILAQPLDVEKSYTGQAVKHKKALVFNDNRLSPFGQHIPGTPDDDDERVIVAPFEYDGTVLGAMCLNRLGVEFTREDLALAETFAAYATTVLRNVQHHDALEKEVEERRRIEQQLIHDAFHDGLTGLPNRALFNDRLGLAIHRAKRSKNYRSAVLFLDLDRFKVVNDSLGHIVGDQLLVAFARRLIKVTRSVDTVARLGGDEFALLLEYNNDQSGELVAVQRIKDALRKPFRFGDHVVHVTTSIGIVNRLADYTKPDQVLRDADIAMYRAKELGRDRHEVFDRSMHDQAMARLQMETELRQAIARKELVLYYQPIVSLRTHSLVGFEALIRWVHPQKGIVPPGSFLPLAEETGLIIPMGDWVLGESCRQLAAWAPLFSESAMPTISVNLSDKQFKWPGLLPSINQALEQSGIEPALLKIEITEGTVMDDVGFSTRVITALQDLGVQVHMDDFGTGYSSLGALHQFPIDSLKIDRSFISQMQQGDDKLAFVRTIIGLAHNLGMDVIAEGVENAEQASALVNLECEFAQGFHFHRPLQAEQVADVIRR